MNKKLIGIAVLGAGAYFLYNNQVAQAQPIGEAPSGNRGVMDGIGTGGGGAMITTTSPTGTATGGDTYNTTYNFESPNIDFAPASLDQQQTTGQQATAPKKEITRPSGAYSSEILQQSFRTEAEGKQAEASAKKTATGSSYFNLPQTSSYFNIPTQYKPSTQGTTPATADHQAPKKTATTSTPTAPFTPVQAVSLVPTAIINPIGAIAQASGFLLGNFFRGR